MPQLHNQACLPSKYRVQKTTAVHIAAVLKEKVGCIQGTSHWAPFSSVRTLSLAYLIPCCESTARHRPQEIWDVLPHFNITCIFPDRFLLRAQKVLVYSQGLTAFPFLYQFLFSRQDFFKAPGIPQGPIQSVWYYQELFLGYQGEAFHFSNAKPKFPLQRCL